MIECSEIMKALKITADDVVDRLAHHLRDEFDGSVRELFRAEVAKIAQQAAPKIIDEYLSVAVSEVINGTYQPVNEWNEPKGNPISLREMVQKRCIAYLDEKVDHNGTPGTYNATCKRSQWLANKAAADAVDHAAKSQINEAVQVAKAEIKKRLAAHIAETMMK